MEISLTATPWLRSCCLCFTLQTGCWLAALYSTVSTCVLLGLISYNYIILTDCPNKHFLCHISEWSELSLKILFLIGIVLCVMNILLSLLLVFAAYRHSLEILIAWISSSILFSVFVEISGIMLQVLLSNTPEARAYADGYFMVALFHIPLFAFLWLVVISFYQILRDGFHEISVGKFIRVTKPYPGRYDIVPLHQHPHPYHPHLGAPRFIQSPRRLQTISHRDRSMLHRDGEDNVRTNQDTTLTRAQVETLTRTRQHGTQTKRHRSDAKIVVFRDDEKTVVIRNDAKTITYHYETVRDASKTRPDEDRTETRGNTGGGGTQERTSVDDAEWREEHRRAWEDEEEEEEEEEEGVCEVMRLDAEEEEGGGGGVGGRNRVVSTVFEEEEEEEVSTSERPHTYPTPTVVHVSEYSEERDTQAGSKHVIFLTKDPGQASDREREHTKPAAPIPGAVISTRSVGNSPIVFRYPPKTLPSPQPTPAAVASRTSSSGDSPKSVRNPQVVDSLETFTVGTDAENGD